MSSNASRAVCLWLCALLLCVPSAVTRQRSCLIRNNKANCTNLIRSPLIISRHITELTITCTEPYRSQVACNREGLLPQLRRYWIRRFRLLQTIRIENCPYTKFPPLVFADFPHLRKLVLYNLSLTHLSRAALQDTYNLRTIHLENLPCLKVDENLFDKQRQLQEVNLKNTRFMGLEVRHLISRVRRSLTSFSWSKNLIPVSLPIRTFVGFHSLKKVDLTDNRLTDSMDFLSELQTVKLYLAGNPHAYPTGRLDFSSYEQLRTTEVLDLRSMNLRVLPSNALRPLTNLRVLRLANNFLTFISRSLIINMPKLMTLDLSGNSLHSIPQEIEYLVRRRNKHFKYFELKLDGNPFHCNCEIAWLLNYVYKPPNEYQNLKCDTGIDPRLNQKRLGDIRLADLRCKPAVPPTVDIELYGAVKVYNPNQRYPDMHKGEMLYKGRLTQVRLLGGSHDL